MKKLLDVNFTFETPAQTATRHFKNITPAMFYRLRNRFFELYGNKMLAIEVYQHGTKQRIEVCCWFYEEEYNLQADLWEHDGI